MMIERWTNKHSSKAWWIIFVTVFLTWFIYLYIKKDVWVVKYKLGMHDIYQTDKLSTDMGENYVIIIVR